MTAPQAPIIFSPTPVGPEDENAIVQVPLINRALNPNMEPGAFNWTVADSGVIDVICSTATRKSGAHSGRVRWKSSAPAISSRAQLVLTGLAVGQLYGVSLQVLSTIHAARVELHMQGVAPAVNSNRQLKRDGVTWEKLQMRFTALATSMTLQIMAWERAGTGTDNHTFFDELLIAPLLPGEEIPQWFSGNSPGAFWSGPAENANSQKTGIINPDYDFYVNWAYRAPLSNAYDHWKSNIYFEKWNGSSWIAIPELALGDVAVKTASDGDMLRWKIQKPYRGLLGDGGLYRLNIQDMDTSVETFGSIGHVDFNTSIRPNTPSWINPPITIEETPFLIDNLPLFVKWHADAQTKWRMTAIYPDTPWETPQLIWDSGWQKSSIRSGWIAPHPRGVTLLLQLYVHDGNMMSLPAVNKVYLPPAPIVAEQLGGKIELEIYNGLTGEFIDVVPDRISPQYTEELRGSGAGNFTLKLTDPRFVDNPDLIKARNVVRVKDDGHYIGFWVIMGHEPKTIDTGEENQEVVIVKGLGGYGAWPSDAILYPYRATQDFGSSPKNVQPSRMFGVGSHMGEGTSWFDVTNWQGVIQEVRMDNATPVAPGPVGNPWIGAPSDWPSDLTTAYWMWSLDQRDFGKAGTVVFRSTILNGYDYPVGFQFFLAADDEAQVYLDGSPWCYSNSWQTTTKSDIVYVGPGPHDVVIIASCAKHSQDIGDVFLNPAGVLCGAYVYGPAGETAPHGAFLQSNNTNWICIGYNQIPNWTIGDILQQIYNEARVRGVTSFSLFDLGFDDNIDSYGNPWSKDGTQWVFTTFSEYRELFDKLTDSAAEIWFDENLILQGARTRGIDRGALNPPGNFLDLVRQDGAAFIFDFHPPILTATLTTIFGPLDVEYILALDGADGAAIVQGVDPDPSEWAAAGWTLPPTNLATVLEVPYDGIRGLKFSHFEDHGGLAGFSLASAEVLTGGNITFPLTGEDGFAFEWFTTDAYFALDVHLVHQDWIYNPLDPSAFDNEYDLHIEYQDYTNVKFDTSLLSMQDAQGVFETQAYLRHDVLGHHWLLNIYNTGVEASVAVLYRDGVEILSSDLNMDFVAGGTYMAWTFDSGNSTPPIHTRTGLMSIYQRLLTEDEIYTHAQKAKNVDGAPGTEGYNNFQRTDAIIFQKAKNVLSASATIDFAGKTVMAARSATSTMELLAGISQLQKYGRIEGYYDGSSKAAAEVRRTTVQAIISSLASQSSNAIEVNNDYKPWRDYGVGDWVLAPGDYGEELIRRRLVSISVAEDSATQRKIYAIEVDSLGQENERRLALWMTRTLPTGSLSGLISDSG